MMAAGVVLIFLAALMAGVSEDWWMFKGWVENVLYACRRSAIWVFAIGAALIIASAVVWLWRVAP